MFLFWFCEDKFLNNIEKWERDKTNYIFLLLTYKTFYILMWIFCIRYFEDSNDTDLIYYEKLLNQFDLSKLKKPALPPQ